MCDEQFRGSHRQGQLSTRSPTGRRDERRSSLPSQAPPSFERHVHATDHIQARRSPALARRETPTLAGDAAKTLSPPWQQNGPERPHRGDAQKPHLSAANSPPQGKSQTPCRALFKRRASRGRRASGRSWARHREKLLLPVRHCSPRGSAARLPTALAEHNEQYASIPLRADRTRLTIGAATGEKARRGMRQGRALLATPAQVPGRCSDGAA